MKLHGLQAALARGEAAKRVWVTSGDLISGAALAAAWGVSDAVLSDAVARGQAFLIFVDGQPFYPKEFAELDAETVSTIVRALGSLCAIEKYFFWRRRHGALGGMTVQQVLRSEAPDALKRVAQFARASSAQSDADAAMRSVK